jgi:hypothetical protein
MLQPSGTSKKLLRVALPACDARCTAVQLRFSAGIAAARDVFRNTLRLYAYVLKFLALF